MLLNKNDSHIPTFHHLIIYFNNYVISSVYIPPSSPSLLYESHMETVESLINANPTYTYLICGDYNLPGLSWSNDSDGLTFSSTSSSSGSCVPKTFASLNFFQHNSVLNSSQSTLDLIFSNIANISVEKSLNHLVPCDSFHPALEISLLTIPHIPFVNNSHTFFDFRKSDYPKIISFLNSFDWSSNYSTLMQIQQLIACMMPYIILYSTSFPKFVLLRQSFLPGSQRN